MVTSSVDINRSASVASGAISPQNLFARGAKLLKAAQPEKAIEYFNRAQQIAPNLPDINFAKAVALAQLGNIEQAQDACKAELKLNSAHEGAAKLLDKLAVFVST